MPDDAQVIVAYDHAAIHGVSLRKVDGIEIGRAFIFGHQINIACRRFPLKYAIFRHGCNLACSISYAWFSARENDPNGLGNLP